MVGPGRALSVQRAARDRLDTVSARRETAVGFAGYRATENTHEAGRNTCVTLLIFILIIEVVLM